MTERQIPSNSEAEEGVLGCVLLSPQECIPEVAAKCPSVEVFYNEQLKTLWHMLLSMHEKNEAIDMITVRARLKERGLLEAVGGLAYIAELPNKVPSAANLDYYLGIILEAYEARRTIQVCEATINSIYGGVPGSTAVSHLEFDILKLTSGRIGSCDWDIKPALRGVIKEIAGYQERVGQLEGLATGFIDFDRITGGLRPEQLVVVAGRPSVGKSSWCLNVAEHIAVDNRIPVGYFSFEMSKESLMRRLLAGRARTNLRWAKDGFMNDEVMQKLSNASGRIAGAPLYIDDQPAQNIVQTRSKARRMVLKHGVKVLVVDYFQLMHGFPGKRYRSDSEELADISNAMKELARELKIPIVLLSQLNREVDKDRKGRKPRMSDLKGSGSLEQDADIIGLLYRASAKNRYKVADDDDEVGPAIPVNMLIDKHREGDTPDLHFTFLRNLTRFETAAKIESEPEQEMMNYQPHNDP